MSKPVKWSGEIADLLKFAAGSRPKTIHRCNEGCPLSSVEERRIITDPMLSIPLAPETYSTVFCDERRKGAFFRLSIYLSIYLPVADPDTSETRSGARSKHRKQQRRPKILRDCFVVVQPHTLRVRVNVRRRCSVSFRPYPSTGRRLFSSRCASETVAQHSKGEPDRTGPDRTEHRERMDDVQ